MHQVTPTHTFYLDGARVIARPQACITNGHKHQEQRDNAHLLHLHWLPNDCDQRLATIDKPHRYILSRVRYIAWFAVVGGSYSERNRSYSSWPPIQYQKNVSS
jgi:hypothetical protein